MYMAEMVKYRLMSPKVVALGARGKGGPSCSGSFDRAGIGSAAS
jgi:hypothetical protein